VLRRSYLKKREVNNKGKGVGSRRIGNQSTMKLESKGGAD